MFLRIRFCVCLVLHVYFWIKHETGQFCHFFNLEKIILGLKMVLWLAQKHFFLNLLWIVSSYIFSCTTACRHSWNRHSLKNRKKQFSIFSSVQQTLGVEFFAIVTQFLSWLQISLHSSFSFIFFLIISCRKSCIFIAHYIRPYIAI